MNDPIDSLGPSPALFPHVLDVRNDSISFVRLGRPDYADASFLDGRTFDDRTLPRVIAWPQVAAWIDAARLTERCGYIFHIGHVGSTLLSRLIGLHAQAFAIREPLVLRTFALMRSEPHARPRVWSREEFDARLGGVLKLLSRTFDPGQIAVIKATSFVSEIASELLTRAAAPRALMMTVSPETYLATIFGGPNSRQEARILAPQRLKRLQARVGGEHWQLESMSEGESLALAWACEASALSNAAQVAGGRVMRIDFDGFLADPAAGLHPALGHFGIDATLAEVRAILAGPDMGRYSKAPQFAYDSALRQEVLGAARAAHGAEIRRGLAWLERAARSFQPLREAVAFAANREP
jgi:hypothetical protein